MGVTRDLAAESNLEDGDRRRRLWRRERPPGPRLHRSASICVASGKGGTGKSVFTASLAALCAERGRTLIVDADMGVGNAHILQDVPLARSFVDVVRGDVSVGEAVSPCGPGLDLVAAGSGVSHMAELDFADLLRIARGIAEVEEAYAYVLVDSAAGISNQTVAFAAACDLVVLVTTPDATAMTDAYAFLKVLRRQDAGARVRLVVNRAPSPSEACRVADRIRAVAAKFLGTEPTALGSLPDDQAVVRSVAERRPVVLSEPDTPAARALRLTGEALIEELEHLPHPGLGRVLLHELESSPAAGR